MYKFHVKKLNFRKKCISLNALDSITLLLSYINKYFKMEKNPWHLRELDFHIPDSLVETLDSR